MVDQNALVNGRIENNVNLLIVKVLLTFFFIYYFKSVKLHIQTTYPQCILDSNHLCFHRAWDFQNDGLWDVLRHAPFAGHWWYFVLDLCYLPWIWQVEASCLWFCGIVLSMCTYIAILKSNVPVLGSFLCEGHQVLFPMCCVLPNVRGFDSVYGFPVFQLLSVSGKPQRNQVLYF